MQRLGLRQTSQENHMLEKLINFGNLKRVARMIEIWENLRKYFEWLQSKFPKSDGRFIEVQKILKQNRGYATPCGKHHKCYGTITGPFSRIRTFIS